MEVMMVVEIRETRSNFPNALPIAFPIPELFLMTAPACFALIRFSSNKKAFFLLYERKLFKKGLIPWKKRKNLDATYLFSFLFCLHTFLHTFEKSRKRAENKKCPELL
jgi:hypothetical protein